ncbi:S49 family peptidase [Marinomonas epiphytica]
MSWTEQEDQLQADKTANEQTSKEMLATPEADQSKLWQLLEDTLKDSIVEKRRARRWKIFFRLSLMVIIVAALIGGFLAQDLDEFVDATPSVAVIPMRGVIGSEQDIDSTEYVQIINEAYNNPYTQGVLIQLNSPGGSPVHSGILYDAISEKRAMFPTIPVIVIVEDMAASGGYYIASAADEIYANQASLVGSIGVVSAGFDFTGLLDKAGVERRIFTAGRNKAFLDPFSALTDEAKEKWQSVLDETHQQFIAAVKSGRGDRLTIDEDVFSGLVFTGNAAVSNGLIDGISNTNKLLQERFNTTNTVVYQPYEESWRSFAKELGVELMDSFLLKQSLH